MPAHNQLDNNLVRPLLNLLHDPDKRVRTEALWALVRLPLSEEAWEEIAGYVLERLENPSLELNIPRYKLIDIAVYVPDIEVRRRLRRMLSDSDEEDRRRAALALVRARDTVALPVFLDHFWYWTEEDALALAGVDITKALSQAKAVNDAAAIITFAAAYAMSLAGERWALEQLERGQGIASWPTLSDLAKWLEHLLPLDVDSQDLRQTLAGNEALSMAAAGLASYLQSPSTAAMSVEDAALILSGVISRPSEFAARGVFVDFHEMRFWLSIALARVGEPESLAQILRTGADFWPDPNYFEDQLSALPPLPSELRPWFEEKSDRLDSFAWNILHYLGFEPDPADKQVEETLEAVDSGPDLSHPEMKEKQTEPFQPDIRALVPLYMTAASNYYNRAPESLQLSWLISRAALKDILTAIKPYLEDEDPKVRADAAVLLTLVRQYESVDFAPRRPILSPFESVKGDGVDFLPPDPAPPIFTDDNFDSQESEDVEDLDQSAEEDSAVDGSAGEGEEGWELNLEKGIPDWDEETKEAVDEEPQRVINTGFAHRDPPQQRLTPFQPLQAGAGYYYWFEEDIPDTTFGIDTTPVSRPEVPVEAELTIALFEFDGELQVQDGADIGRMKVTENGKLTVVSQPVDYEEPLPKQKQRLYFPVRVPAEPGEYHMRCNMYWGQMLLQSRLITVTAVLPGTAVEEGQRQLRSDLDYTISNTLDAEILNNLEPHRMSLMLNSNVDATHSVHVFGGSNGAQFKKSDIRFEEGELQNLIESARSKLRKASWKDTAGGGMIYLYEDGARNLERLKNDLAEMAQSGFKFYSKFIGELDPGGKAKFRELLAGSGQVQIAFKRSPRHLLPAALIYDRPIFPGAQTKKYRLCSRFEQAFKNGEDLSSTPCFQGNCPESGREHLMVVCPSGFWGFRHSLGMPVSLCDLDEEEQLDPDESCDTPDMPAVLEYRGQFEIGAGIATDLDMWNGHKTRLQSLKQGLGWSEADDLQEVFDVIEHPPHLIYFYCHGGIDEDGGATLRFGSENNPARIGGWVFEMLDVRWQDRRPLVFINGCHTTGVSPEQALDLVTPLIRRASASGVIGTEITIFEPLATRFAELCLGHFFSGIPIGEAIRRARVGLLMEGNPLGLVYIPFVQGGLKLVEKP